MNRFRLLAIGTMLMLALAVVAQQAATRSGGPAKGNAHGNGVPTVEGHLKVLTEKLALTGDQQTKIKPILQELHDATLKAVQDESMSREERLGKVRTSPEKADKKIREILNDDQKKKLDQLEHEPHSELHGMNCSCAAWIGKGTASAVPISLYGVAALAAEACLKLPSAVPSLPAPSPPTFVPPPHQLFSYS